MYTNIYTQNLSKRFSKKYFPSANRYSSITDLKSIKRNNEWNRGEEMGKFTDLSRIKNLAESSYEINFECFTKNILWFYRSYNSNFCEKSFCPFYIWMNKILFNILYPCVYWEILKLFMIII